ncbi:CpaF family protein [Cellulomonas xiejunii]|uniref:CpaF family protein n=1 Tax=Cellulomonas xiejunii TaxID=2968083 RepID=A0ABY5KNH1_9CELL|nr:CpaF family protein [Cellulomonas xiejunii]MCC2312726.1 CpaF family protein [Cellulomonas xiejunii]MCC2320404.1 CpaF family protein [Cellulomonas xiejunii]UUI70701.1 CpaF family protein [Cellulomonas xiejunii]
MSGYTEFSQDPPAQQAVTSSPFARSELDEQLVGQFKRKLLDEVDLHELGRLEPGQRRVRLERVVAHLVSTEGVILTTRERNALIRRVVDESIGLGVLEPLLADETVSEIMINGHDTLYVERFGQLERVGTAFASEEQLRQTIDRIVSTVNRRVDESSPMVDARLPADERMPRGARVHVVLPPLALDGPTVTIRLFPRAYGLDELLRRGTLDAATAELLAACVRARANIVVSGGTSSGKTTFLNALSAFIQGRQRIITIEDAAELSLSQEHVIRLETRPANVEGQGQVTIRDLVRNALRMRPDRVIVGEVRGGEALDMLQAMNTGHEGSLATVHANSSVDALIRLETLASMSDVDVPFHALRDQVNNAIDIVVQLLRGSDGTRRVVEVGWVASRHREDFEVRPIMHWDPEAEGPSGTPGTFVLHPMPQALADKLRIAGEPIGIQASAARAATGRVPSPGQAAVS